MAVFSPLAATFGARGSLLLEGSSDYARYHAKLGRKLIKLRHRCQLITKLGNKSKDKVSKSAINTKRSLKTRSLRAISSKRTINVEDYDKKSKLYGLLVLLECERDLALVETLKCRARSRGRFKRAERKWVRTRLRRALREAQRLVDLTVNEKQWRTRAQVLAYYLTIRAEYGLHGSARSRPRRSRGGERSTRIARDLSLVFALLKVLDDDPAIKVEGQVASSRTSAFFDSIRSQYEFELRNHAGGLVTQEDLHNFIVDNIRDILQKSGDEPLITEMANLLVAHGLSLDRVNVSKVDDHSHISWRSFNCVVRNQTVAQLIQEARALEFDNTETSFDMRLLKWEEALSSLSKHTKADEQLDNDADDSENTQILSAYIQFQQKLTSLQRDIFFFERLWAQWQGIGITSSIKLIKYNEIEKIINNICKWINDSMDLPGVYSDESLLKQLENAETYYKAHLKAACLSPLYQYNGKYMEALALSVNCYELTQDLETEFSEILPVNVYSASKIRELRTSIESNIKSVAILASYESQLLSSSSKHHRESSMLEKLETADKIIPAEVNLKNLAPLRPKMQPVPSKPALFDMAFNYIKYDGNEKTLKNEPKASFPTRGNEDTTIGPTKKRRGFLGLFGR